MPNDTMDDAYRIVRERLGAARAYALLQHAVTSVGSAIGFCRVLWRGGVFVDTLESGREMLRELAHYVPHSIDVKRPGRVLLNHLLRAAVERGSKGTDTPVEAIAAIEQLVAAGANAAANFGSSSFPQERRLGAIVDVACERPWLLATLLRAAAPAWSQEKWGRQLVRACVAISIRALALRGEEESQRLKREKPAERAEDFAAHMLAIVLEPIGGRCPPDHAIVEALCVFWTAEPRYGALGADLLLTLATPYLRCLTYTGVLEPPFNLPPPPPGRSGDAHSAHSAPSAPSNRNQWHVLATRAALKTQPPASLQAWVRTGFLAPGELMDPVVLFRLGRDSRHDVEVNVRAYVAAVRDAAWARRAPAVGGWRRGRAARMPLAHLPT